MGWDAYATVSERSKKMLKKDWHEFIHASKNVQKETGSVDWLLKHGGLDCVACKKAIEQATGYPAENRWSINKVRAAHSRARWPVSPTWSDLSAKRFLELCSKFGLGIWFDTEEKNGSDILRKGFDDKERSDNNTEVPEQA